MDNPQVPVDNSAGGTSTSPASYPATQPITTNQVPDDMSRRKKSKKSQNTILVVAIILALIIGVVLLLKNNNFNLFTSKDDPDSVIAKVGNEKIYKKDLDNEVIGQMAKDSPNIRTIMLEKLLDDSVILQGGQAEKLITLDSSIYNTTKKDYAKRQKAVSDIRSNIEKNGDTVEGTLVAVWFLNNRVGPLGYDKSKEIARTKISKLYDQVKSKTITIRQAGEQIAKDTSLAQLDPSYKVNALMEFKIKKDTPFTFNDNFNTLVWNSPPSTLTEIVTLQSQDYDNGGKIVDAYYVFAQINNKTENGIPFGFDGWLMHQKKTYAITKY